MINPNAPSQPAKAQRQTQVLPMQCQTIPSIHPFRPSINPLLLPPTPQGNQPFQCTLPRREGETGTRPTPSIHPTSTFPPSIIHHHPHPHPHTTSRAPPPAHARTASHAARASRTIERSKQPRLKKSYSSPPPSTAPHSSHSSAASDSAAVVAEPPLVDHSPHCAPEADSSAPCGSTAPGPAGCRPRTRARARACAR